VHKILLDFGKDLKNNSKWRLRVPSLRANMAWLLIIILCLIILFQEAVKPSFSEACVVVRVSCLLCLVFLLKVTRGYYCFWEVASKGDSLLNLKNLRRLENNTTITELPLIDALEIRGDIWSPISSKTPAAIGIITMLYKNAQAKLI